MKKSAAAAGLAALTLFDIGGETPAQAQNAELFAGAYVGGHVGGFTSDATFTSPAYTATSFGLNALAPARNDPFSVEGSLTGVHAGFNFVLGQSVVGGIEADWSSLDESDSVAIPLTPLTTGIDGFSFQYRSRLDLESQRTIRGRLGFVLGNALIFGTAGVAFLNVDWTEQASKIRNNGTLQENFSHSRSETLVGGVVGGGVEFALGSNIIFGTDYLYEDFESLGGVPHGVEAGQFGRLDNISVHKVRARLSFKFGGGTP